MNGHAETALLEIEGLGKRFGGLVALTDLSFFVRAGAIHGVIGPNGAGKTTLFNLITSMFAPSTGRVSFDGSVITGLNPHLIARRGLARTFQNVRLFREQSVLENVVLGTYCHTRAGVLGGILRLPSATAEQSRARNEAMERLDFVGLAKFGSRAVGELPFGQQRLLELVRALALRPKLLLLDEPAAGLNDAETENLAHLIRSLPTLGVTVLLIEHNMSLMMSVADSIVFLNYGLKLAEGTPAQVSANEQVISAYLGEDA